MIYTYQIPADTEEKKYKNKMFCMLRDDLSTKGISIHYDQFKCNEYFFSVRHIYFNKKIYAMKRCNKRCIEIVDLCDEYKKVKENKI